jgi:hypothetical protein
MDVKDEVGLTIDRLSPDFENQSTSPSATNLNETSRFPQDSGNVTRGDVPMDFGDE